MLRFRSLQICRGLAAALVTLYHLGGAIAAPKYFDLPLFAAPFHFGVAGVEFFFVLSGFIIALVHGQDLNQPKRLPTYLRNRLIRIYPVYWLIFLAVYAVAHATPGLRDGVPDDLLVLLKSLLLVPQDPLVVGGSGAPVLIVAWSLQYEMVFYACMALAILDLRLALLVLGLGAVLLGACPLIGSTCGLLPIHAPRYFLLFAGGLATAWLSQRAWPVRRPLALAIWGAALFLLIGLVQNALNLGIGQAWGLGLLPPVARTLLYGACSMLLIFGLVRAEAAGWRVGGSFFVLLGEASFALYLLHYPLISLLCKVMRALGLTGPLGATVAFCAIFLACIAVAIAFHLWLERPLLRLLRGGPRPRLGAALARLVRGQAKEGAHAGEPELGR